MWTCGHWSERKKRQEHQPSFIWFIFFFFFFRQSYFQTAYGQQFHGVCFSYPFQCNSWKLSVCLLIRIRIFITSSDPFLALSFCLFVVVSHLKLWKKATMLDFSCFFTQYSESFFDLSWPVGEPCKIVVFWTVTSH